MNIDWIVFAVGAVGGALGELLKWYQLRESQNLPAYAKSPFYWIVTGLIILAGGVLAVLYKIPNSQLLLAANVGVTAPLIIKGLANAVPKAPEPKALGEPPSPTVIDFLAGR